MTDLSILVPAYNEASRLNFYELLTWMDKMRSIQFEVLIVENGSTDSTLEIAHYWSGMIKERGYPCQVLRSSPGKGAAVAAGMLAATGDWRMMCDADWSMPPDDILLFWGSRAKADVLIGSRELPGSDVVEPLTRRLTGRAFNYLVRLALGLPYRDTQCGYKMFAAPVSEKLFGKLFTSGWGFDIEILYRARMYKYNVLEIPIRWQYDPDSRVNLVKDAWRMAIELYKIWDHYHGKRNQRRAFGWQD
jgi:glycosyltransferase involved in cell wall biosynthesis